ncbi:MAG: MFS transporter [Planctomycetes bacterium]|nr:MFS transporter [Planctomycetota bacterium]
MRTTLHDLFGHGRGKVLAFAWLGWVFDFFDLFLFSLLNKTIARDLGLNENLDIAWIDGWFMAATAVGGFGLGWVADRYGRRHAMVWSILCYSIGTLLTGMAEGYWSLLVARLVTAIGVGGEWGIGHALVAETYPRHLRGRAAGILQAGTPFAIALAAVFGCFCSPYLGWRACFLWAAAPAVLVFFARWAVPAQNDVPQGSKGSLVELVQGEHLRRSLTIWLLVAVHLAAFWSSYSWMPRILLGQGWSMQQLGVYQIVVASAQMTGNVLFGFLADRYGRRPMFVAHCLLFSAGLLVIIGWFDALIGNGVAITAAMACTALGLGTWSAFGPMFADNFPERLRAMASSGIFNLGRTQQLLVQPIAGHIRAGGSDVGVLVLGAGMGLLSALVLFLVPRTPPAATKT